MSPPPRIWQLYVHVSNALLETWWFAGQLSQKGAENHDPFFTGCSLLGNFSELATSRHVGTQPVNLSNEISAALQRGFGPSLQEALARLLEQHGD